MGQEDRIQCLCACVVLSVHCFYILKTVSSNNGWPTARATVPGHVRLLFVQGEQMLLQS